MRGFGFRFGGLRFREVARLERLQCPSRCDLLGSGLEPSKIVSEECRIYIYVDIDIDIDGRLPARNIGRWFASCWLGGDQTMFHRSLKGLLAQLFFCFYAPRFVGEVRAGRFSRASRKTNREVVQEVSRRRLAEDLTVVHREAAELESREEQCVKSPG